MTSRNFFIVLCIGLLTSCVQKKDYLVTIKTPQGDMLAILSDKTPKHKENFIKLAKEGFFDSLLFHRVIKDFMIQGGDPESKNAPADQPLGGGGPGYTIPAEIDSTLFHEKGALSAARLGDDQNPNKESSGSQFYIVQGTQFDKDRLTSMEEGMNFQRKNNNLRTILFMPENQALLQMVRDKQTAGENEWLNQFFTDADTIIHRFYPNEKPIVFSEAQIEAYSKTGGYPPLDGEYTVFGKVVKGLDVLDSISNVPTNEMDRPMEDVRMTVTVEEMSRKKIEELTGYTYPEDK